MATQSSTFPTREKQTSPLEEPIPDWKASILEKKRRAKEIELLLKEEEELKLKSIPEWKLELIKRTRSTVKAPVFKTAAPPIPTTPPPTTVETPGVPLATVQQDYPPLPTWIRKKLSQVANQLRSEHKEDTQPDIEPEQEDIQPNLPRMVQNIVHKFSNTTPPPSPLSPSSLPLLYFPDTPEDTNLMDDPSLAQLPDWKRSIMVRRKRGQVLKRLSLTKDDLDIVTSVHHDAQNKSTPDNVDILLQNMSTLEELKSTQVETEEGKETPVESPPPVERRASIGSPRSLFITQEPQKKVKELLDKFAPSTTHSIPPAIPPFAPKSIKLIKRDFDQIPVPPHLQVKPPPEKEPPAPSPAPPLPISPECILTVQEYNRHHALLVQAIARQYSSPLVNGSENMFSFIIPDNSPSKRPRSRSLESPISSVDPIKLITDISQPIFAPPPPKFDDIPPDAAPTAEVVGRTDLEEVTLSYIDEVSAESVVPIHRPPTEEQDLSVPWKDALDKIKLKRRVKEGPDVVETLEKEIIIISSQEGLNLKSSLRGHEGRSKRRRVYFSDKKPSVFQYPKMDPEGMHSYTDNQEDLSHRLHPSIFSSRQPYQSDKLQNYTPAILDYFDSLVSPPSQNMWVQGEDTRTRGPTRDESDETVINTLTAVPLDAEEELDMTNLSDRAAAMIW